MKKFKLLSLLLIISLFVTALSVPALALDAPELTAQSVVVLDADNGSVLFQRNGSRSVDPGPMTTMMTALLAADAIDRQDIFLDDAVTATDNARAGLTEDSITSDPAIVSGEVLTVEDLIYLCLFRSSVDAANTLAEYASGSIDLFLESMNRRAGELGCEDTQFVNVNGELAEGQRSTARDMAIIAKAVMADTTLSNLLKAANYTVGATEAADARELKNPVPFTVEKDENYYENAFGVKMATLTDLGSCLAASASYNEMNIITVVLGCEKNAVCLSETRNLFDWVFGNFDHRLILSATETIDSLPVELGSPGSVDVRAETSLSLILPLDQQLGKVEYEISYDHEQAGLQLQAPIDAGDALGTVTVYMDGEEYGTSRLVAAKSVDISRMDYLRAQLDVMLHTKAVRQILTTLIVVLAVYVLLVGFYMVQRFRHLRSLRRARRDRAIAHAHQETEWLDIPGDDGGDEPEEEGYEEPAPEDGDEPAEERGAAALKTRFKGLFHKKPRTLEPEEEEDDGDGYGDEPAPEDEAEDLPPEDEAEDLLPEDEELTASPKRKLLGFFHRKKRAPEPEEEEYPPEEDGPRRTMRSPRMITRASPRTTMRSPRTISSRRSRRRNIPPSRNPSPSPGAAGAAGNGKTTRTTSTASTTNKTQDRDAKASRPPLYGALCRGTPNSRRRRTIWWPPCVKGAAAADFGAPAGNQRSVSRGERRSAGAGECWRERQRSLAYAATTRLGD